MAQTQKAETIATAMEVLVGLLQKRLDHPETAATIDREIRDRFTQTQAVMVMDMVGFSRQTQQAGIIPILAEIYRLRSLAVPVLETSGGRVFKAAADNLYAVFPHPAMAVAATDRLLNCLNAANLHASAGN